VKMILAAQSLPAEEMKQFFTAYGSGLEKDSSGAVSKRLNDSHTTQICFFLLFARPLIKARHFKTITQLFGLFMQIVEVDPKEKSYYEANPNMRVSLERQFRKICVQDKLRLRGRGRPRNN
jgi:hypothetical protein